MFKKKQVELIKAINYPKEIKASDLTHFGYDNRLYRSLLNLFQWFWIYNKKELYLVGGCVRDMLLGKEPKDYDLCTNATPEEAKQLCESLGLKTFDSGIKHGTITIIDDFYGQSYELTTYRVDGKYSDGRHPDEVTFTPSLEEDLKRRDFTINSFAYDLLLHEVIMLDESYFEDLKLGIIKTVGDPNLRFKEDALRMLRAIRFSAQLGFTIDKDTYKSIEQNASDIQNISKERIRDELTKILLSDNPQMLEHFCLTGLEYWAFATNGGWTPIKAMLECTQHNKYHYTDVFHHTMDVIRRLPKDFDLRWAALLHDIGKPLDKTTDDEGWEHFYHHAEKSITIAEILMDLLKFSNESKEKILKFVKYHDYPLSKVNNSKFKKKIVEIGEENFVDFLKLREADALAHNLAESVGFAIEAVSICKERYKQYRLNPEPMRVRDLAINGNDIVADGFLRGKEIGDCLNWMLNIVLEHPEYNNKEKLLELLQEFKEMSFQST